MRTPDPFWGQLDLALSVTTLVLVTARFVGAGIPWAAIAMSATVNVVVLRLAYRPGRSPR